MIAEAPDEATRKRLIQMQTEYYMELDRLRREHDEQMRTLDEMTARTDWLLAR